jgi:uncharacterized protein YdiU (UPF0061 family)
VVETEPLIEALNRFGPEWQAETGAAFVMRLGVETAGPEADAELATAALKLLSEAGGRLRWEPLFFDWFGGPQSATRAMKGPRAEVYAGETFEAFRGLISQREAVRPERLDSAYFARPEPQELIYDEIEQIWAAIAEKDDWELFRTKIAAIGEARDAYAIAEP